MNSLPVIKQLAVEPDVVSLFCSLCKRPYSFLLDSGMRMKEIGRYSFMGCDPFLVFRAKNDRVEIKSGDLWDGDSWNILQSENPLPMLQSLLKHYSTPGKNTPVPFGGGAVGYFSYDLGRRLERLPEIALDDMGLPDILLGFYDVIAAVDHELGKVYIISTGFPEMDPTKRESRARERLQQMEEMLTRPCGGHFYHLYTELSTGLQDLKSNFDEDSYCRVVERAKEYIAAGDIFQVNLSQRFCLSAKIEPWDIYKELRQINPAPFAAYLKFHDLAVVCASPERFLKVFGSATPGEGVAGSRVETRPIKGTRPRGKTVEDDNRLKKELWNSEKDRAELVMIVDMERNDLGRVCKTGSVTVPDLYRLEEYATVFHLVATVEGELPPDKDVIDLLASAFPGGSISGAPKVRAMEIIEELEPVRRGIYTGSIGYLGFNGNTDLNIVIRTMLFKGGNIYFQVGGGITIDSDPRQEYQETLDKARALIMALGLSQG